ncbi:hypothetical protein TrLO_g10826 [Triparma laevis f. longispina]|uniref:Uncharacterized protein n=1 Tax=Triparma laevis f. longispina TaxID=1714387 RepID=A0A9W7FUE4_9STRA|nr:hypothetical protein TrLO_g10826 [Triparma laevis f. longispina]
MAMFVDDFVEEEELENPSLKILLLGPPLSGKSTLITTLLSLPSPPPPTYTISYHETILDSYNLMIYDTPSNIFNKVDKEKDNSLSLSNIGGIIICLDIVTNGAVDTQEEEEYEKFDTLYSYLTVIREKVGKGKLPPIVLAFTKWDLAANLGWETKGSPLRRSYASVLRIFDSVFGRGYGVKRLNGTNSSSVSDIFSTVIKNFGRWGKGKGVQLEDINNLSVKKSTPRSKPSTPSSTSNINSGPKTPQQGWGDDVIDDVDDVSKELFKDGDEGEGSVTPSRRRTKGRKSIIQNTREKVKDECTVS